MARTINWTEMSQGTREDYRYLQPLYEDHTHGQLVQNLITLMGLLKGPKLGYQVDRYQHSLQSASRAMRNNESVDLVVGCLLHDIGDGFAPENHSEAAAALLAPYVDDQTHWIVQHHGIFQGYYYFHHLGGDRNARERYHNSPHYQACVNFCADFDQNCFDPDYPNLSMDDFLPALNEVFSRPSRVPLLAST